MSLAPQHFYRPSSVWSSSVAAGTRKGNPAGQIPGSLPILTILQGRNPLAMALASEAGDQPELLSVKPIEKEQSLNEELLDLSGVTRLEGCRKVSKRPLEGLDAFVLQDVLTAEQCSELRRRSEAAGYSFWNASAKKDFRSAFTVEVHSEELAGFIWNRIKDQVVQSVNITKEDSRRWMRDVEGEWVAYGVNPSLVLARYRDGGHFSPHTDGYTIVDFNKRSLYSLLLYLNDCESGGATRLFPVEACGQQFTLDGGGRFRWAEDSVCFSCPCAEGTALAFYQDIPHEGEPVYSKESEKYIIRTDIMYRRKEPICDKPRDLQAYKLFREAELLEADGECQQAAGLFRRAFKMSPDLAEVMGFV